MARIRSIKPEFWTSEQLAECSTTARLLFVGIWTFSDDAGIHPNSMKRLKMEIFPADDFSSDDIAAMVAELLRNRLLEKYEVDGESYLMVTGWGKHQKIDRPTFRHPLPEDSTTPRRHLDEPSPPESNGVESSRVDIPDRPVSVRAVNVRDEWGEILPSVKEITAAVDPGRRLKPNDRELAIKAAVFARVLNGEVSAIVAAIEQKRKQERISRPWGYLKKSLIRVCKESGVDFDRQWAAIEIPDDLLKPAGAST